MSAADVVALQAEMVDVFRTPEPGRNERIGVQLRNGPDIMWPSTMFADLLDSTWRAGLRGAREAQGYRPSSNLARNDLVTPIVANGLVIAHPVRVQENMTPEIIRRADALGTISLATDPSVRPHRLNGFAMFEQPVSLDYDGDPDAETLHHDDVGVRAISWTAVAEGEVEDTYDATGTRAYPESLSWAVTAWGDRSRVSVLRDYRDGNRWFDVPVEIDSPLVPLMSMPLAWTDTLHSCPYTGTSHGDLARLRSPLRIAFGLWQLCGEVVPAPERATTTEARAETVDRRTMRRARRAGLNNPQADVTSLVLRRERPVPVARTEPVDPDGPKRGNPHTTRTEVEAYYAWRWVGSERLGTRKRVRRRISAHWSNNDESLPVRKRTVVDELRR